MKTIAIPLNVINELLSDVETMLSEHTKKTYVGRGFTLASIDKISELAGYHTPCPTLNKWIDKNKARLAALPKAVRQGKTLGQLAVELHARV